jgi:putative ABC transport system permease protein
VVSVALKQAWAHKRRLAGTLLAVFLGAAFLSGTLVLGDTLRANFDSLFAGASAGTDAVVRSANAIEASSARRPARVRGLIDASLVDRIRSIDGVAVAAPSIQGYGQLIGRNGKAVGGNGPPRMAGNWITEPDLNPYRLVEGRAPVANDEVVINRGAAKDGGLGVGDITTLQTPDPIRVRIVGIATFGDADGFGRSTFAAFTLAGAERSVTKQPGRTSSIRVEAVQGVTQQQLADRIRAVLPRGVEVLTGEQYTQENIDQVSGQFLAFFRSFLLVFAGIALLVATFSINNTFSIIQAQRTRESALLRALGASRSQVLVTVAVEAFLVGLVATGTGLLGGAGIAGLLKGLFDSFGFALPAGGLVFTGATVVATLAVGMVVTLVAALAPAIRGSRVPPLAAVRDVAVDTAGLSGVRAVAGATVTALGVAAVVASVLGGGGLRLSGLGAVATLVGVVVLGPVVARATGGAIGSPVAKLRGVTGALAQRNAVRNPRRTAGTSAALMVGVAVVTLFTVFVASLKASIDRSVSGAFGGDLVVTAPSFGGGGLSPRLAASVQALPEVRRAVGLGTGTVRIGGTGREVSVADPTGLADLLDLHVTDGSMGGLGDGELAVSEAAAEDRGWKLGSAVRVGFADGATDRLTVGAIYDTSDVVGDYVLPVSAWAPHAVQATDSSVFIALRSGVSLAAGKAAVERVARSFGAPDVQDREDFVESESAGLNVLLGLVYVMLALAILIALMGIANTLSLSIYERVRELALLRAVGATRGQVRSMVRWESVIIALLGTLGGLALGSFLGWALVRAASQEATGVFSAPPAQLMVVLVLGGVAGLVAGLRPARRAARLRMMEAIATE